MDSGRMGQQLQFSGSAVDFLKTGFNWNLFVNYQLYFGSIVRVGKYVVSFLVFVYNLCWLSFWLESLL